MSKTPKMVEHLHLSVDLPGDPDERKMMRAEAVQTALAAVAVDPAFRLRMILGESYQRFIDVALYAAEQIERDEVKAPGLKALALQWGVCMPQSDHATAVQQQIITAAIAFLAKPPLAIED